MIRRDAWHCRCRLKAVQQTLSRATNCREKYMAKKLNRIDRPIDAGLPALILVLVFSARSCAESFSVAAVLRHDEALAEAHDVELRDNWAFVPGKGGSIAIVDVTVPTAPRLAWFRRDAKALPDAETVLLSKDRLYLGTMDFHSIDITNPRAPVFRAALSDRPRISRINGMVRRDNTIFAANKAGWIDAFDVSDPTKPSLAGAFETCERYDVSSPHDVDLFGPYLVVVDPQGFGRGGKHGKLAVFRVFGDDGVLLPSAQWALTGCVSSQELMGANRVQISGQYAFVGGSLSPNNSNGVPSAKGTVIDLSTPTGPRQVATVSFPDLRGPNGLTVAGNVWFLAGGQTVEAYDISRPTAPRKLATFKSVDAFPTADDNAHDLVYRDGYLYVSGQGDNSFVILRVEQLEIVRLARDGKVREMTSGM
jgi:hypothetical protein